MSEWRKVKLGELYTVHNGLSKGRQFFGTGYPFLTFSNVFNNWFLPNTLESLVQTTEKERNACSIKKGDVFITRTSETMNELGMSSVALKDYPDATYNGFTKRLRPMTDQVLPEYIGYYLRSPKFRGKFMAFSSMTTRASLANDDLLSMEVELPTLEIQQRIANVLARYGRLIENYQKQIQLLEEAAQRLYKEWFIDLRFPRHEDCTIVDGIPEGWNRVSILQNDIFSLVKSRVMQFNGKKKYYATADVSGTLLLRHFEWVEYDNLPSRASIIPVKNSVWFARMSNSYKILNCFGENERLTDEAIISSGFCGFTSKPEYYGFVYNTISSKYFDEEKNIHASGSTQISLTNEGLKMINILLPSVDLIVRYSEIVRPMMFKVEKLRTLNNILTEARDRLLPKLMSGEIEV